MEMPSRKTFNKRKAIHRIVGNTLMAFSLPFTASAGGQHLFATDGFELFQALFVGVIPAFGAFVFTTGHEISKRGNSS